MSAKLFGSSSVNVYAVCMSTVACVYAARSDVYMYLKLKISRDARSLSLSFALFRVLCIILLCAVLCVCVYPFCIKGLCSYYVALFLFSSSFFFFFSFSPSLSSATSSSTTIFLSSSFAFRLVCCCYFFCFVY